MWQVIIGLVLPAGGVLTLAWGRYLTAVFLFCAAAVVVLS